jgi:hypothetical protein
LDGSAWTQVVDIDGTVGVVYTQRPGSLPSAVGWYGGQAIAVYSKTPVGSLNWAKWAAAGGWQLQGPAAMTPALAEQVDFSMVPTGGDGLALFILDQNGKIFAKRYNGSTWSDMNANAEVASSVRASEARAMAAVSR